MKKKFVLPVMLLLSIIFLSGCGTTLSQIKPTEMPVVKQRVNYVIPKKSDSIINSLKSFNFNDALTYTESYRLTTKTTRGLINGPSSHVTFVRGIKIYSNYNNIIMTDYNGNLEFGNNIYGSFVRYTINRNIKEKSNNYIITFTVEKKQVAIGKTLLGIPFKLPIFSENKVMRILKSVSFSYKISATSPYNTASTYDNFVRLLKHQSYKKGHKFMGKIYKQGFYLPIRDFNGNVKLFVSDYAYENGSMAIVDVKVNLLGNQNTNTINIANIVHKINKKIKKIVK